MLSSLKEISKGDMDSERNNVEIMMSKVKMKFNEAIKRAIEAQKEKR